MSIRITLLALLTLISTIGCSPGYAPGAGTSVSAIAVIAAGLLTDVNTGVQQDVSGGWARMGGALYFINNPATNPGHQIWKSSSSGTASELVDVGLGGYINGLVVDTRTTASPTRFYFLVNGTQLWTTDGTNTSMIAQYLDGNGPINATAMNNDLYFQLNGTGNNGKVYKSVAGATPAEVQASTGVSFSAQVSFLPGSSHMYIYDNASPVTVYSHSGSATVATNLGSLTAGSTASPVAILNDDLYYQESATFKVEKSSAGAALAQVLDDTGASIAGTVTLNPGSSHIYILLTAANSKMWSHTGTTANATLVDTTPGVSTPSPVAVVGDDLYYQYSAAFNVRKSVAGAVSQEVEDNTSASFSVPVLLNAGTTHVYISQISAAAEVFSHFGSGATATLVETLTAVNAVTNPTVVSDDFYYQESATFKVFKSQAGAVGGEIKDGYGNSIAAAVAFVPGQVNVMYFHGNAVGGNETYYSHTGAASAEAVTILDGAVGTFNSAKAISVGTNLFFSGASTSPVGLFDSVSGAQAINVGDYTPNGQQDYLCNVANVSVSVGATLFFVANDGTHGCELWKTGGTTATTTRIADIFPGQGSSNPHSMTVVGTRVYFVAQDNSIPTNPSDTFLYYTDAPYTSVNKVTLPSADANPNPQYLTAVGTKLFFGASSSGQMTLYGHESTTSANAAIMASSATLLVNAGSAPFIVGVGTRAYFRAAPNNAVYDVYYFDSTASLTTSATLLTHVNANAGTSSNPTLFANASSGSTLFFSADDGTGVELWKTGGTAGTTTKIRNINGNGAATASSNPGNLTMVGTSLYFTATDNTPTDGGAELYVSFSPWTSATKLTFRSTNPQIGNLSVVGSDLVFTMSEDGTTLNSGLYSTNGTIATTARIHAASDVADNDGGTTDYGFNMTGNNVLNGSLFYVFQSGTTIGNQLYITNGSEAGTGLVAQLNPSPAGGALADDVTLAGVSNFAILGSFLIFAGNNGTDGKQLWFTDGTSWNTEEISNFTPNDNNGANPTLLGIANGVAYYVIGDVNTGRGIYAVTQQ